MKLKLAFVLFKYFPYGGLQRDFLRIANTCVTRGHEVHVITSAWQGSLPPSLFTLHLLKHRGLQNHTRYCSFATKLQFELQQQDYDLVVGFNKLPHLDLYYAADTCYAARIKKERSIFYRLLPRYQAYFSMEKNVFARGKTTEIMLIAHHEQSAFQATYQTESHRFHQLPPGIVKEPILALNANTARASIRQLHSLNDDHLLILMIGSSFKTKGVDRSIHALAALPASLKKRTHLFVIGHDQKNPFIQLVNSYQLQNQVHFLGGLSHVAEYLYAADALLHPAYHENTGTVLLEALVAGLPVITHENCGYAFHIKRAQAGLVLNHPFQQTLFNSALENMLSSDRTHFRDNALNYANRHDLYSMPEVATNIIETLGKKRATLSG